MFKWISAVALGALLSTAGATHASELAAEVAQLRQALTQLQADYEDRIVDLENRLARAERAAQDAGKDAGEAIEIAEQTAIEAGAGTSAANTFNPSIGAVLVTRYAEIDNGWEQIPGFIAGGELGPGEPGLSLGESELNFKASVDPRFFGNLTLGLEDEDGDTEIAIEEAWVQSTSLPHGLTLLGGRYFSGVGYLNKFHRHADDFGDRPLPYQALLGGSYVPDGLQLRWIAPLPLLLEFGTEFNWGSNFPSTGRARTSPDAWTLFFNTGGDIGAGHSWQIGLSYLSADVVDRQADDADDAFTGDSELRGIDFVWKWAPGGNPTVYNLKLQGEYFSREEKGRFAATAYDGDQDGWYLQGVWQFAQGWRIGYRHDEVRADNGPGFAGTALQDPGRASIRDSLMVDWSPSEFSRFRLQYTDDRVLSDGDSQLQLQYIMSVGAHGAHEF